jgi:hypothetical protein
VEYASELPSGLSFVTKTVEPGVETGFVVDWKAPLVIGKSDEVVAPVT